MAGTKAAARSTTGSNTNTFNQQSGGTLVLIVLHSDAFQVGARCRLYPTPKNARGRSRLKQLVAEPESWCQPSELSCCAQHKSILGFYTTPIVQDPDHQNHWVCLVADAYIPIGEYILETPLKSGTRIYQRVRVPAKMSACDPVTGARLDRSRGGGDPLAIDYIVGDGVSLEEALYSLCSYRFEASLGKLREADMAKVQAGGKPESG